MNIRRKLAPERSTSLSLQHPSFRPGLREASERWRMADQFFQLSAEDRREVLAIASDRLKRPVHLLEKERLDRLGASNALRFVARRDPRFKGGTSLSKAYGAIRRFSEDVDLTYDIRGACPHLVGENEEALPKTRSEEKRWSSEVRRRLPTWVAARRLHLSSPMNSKSSRFQQRSASRPTGSTSTTTPSVRDLAMSRQASCWNLEPGRRVSRQTSGSSRAMAPAIVDGVDFPTSNPR